MIPVELLISIGMLVLYSAAVTAGAVKDAVRAMPFPTLVLRFLRDGTYFGP